MRYLINLKKKTIYNMKSTKKSFELARLEKRNRFVYGNLLSEHKKNVKNGGGKYLLKTTWGYDSMYHNDVYDSTSEEANLMWKNIEKMLSEDTSEEPLILNIHHVVAFEMCGSPRTLDMLKVQYIPITDENYESLKHVYSKGNQKELSFVHCFNRVVEEFNTNIIKE